MDATTAASVYGEITIPALRILSVAILLFLLLPLAAILGHAAGSVNRSRMIGEGENVDLDAGKTSLGAILAILGLLLAFSFGDALSLTQTRTGATIKEAAALNTVFLRADYLPDPGRTDLKTAILNYTKTRIAPDEGNVDSLEKALKFLDTSL